MRKYDETNGDKEGGIVPKVLVVLLEEIERRMMDVKDEDGTQLFRFSIVIEKSKLMWGRDVLVQSDANLTSTKHP